MIDAHKAKLQALKYDFLYFAENLLSIRAKSGEIKRFVLNKAQLLIHAQLEAQLQHTGKIRALILKGRQQGCSTLIEARYYWRTTTNRGKYALILTHLQDSTDALFDMTKRYHDLCPPAFRQPTQAASAKELSFADIDSGFGVATAGSKAVGRGRTIQYFHGSEAGFWANADEHMAGLGQAVPDEPGTEVILETTGNGVGNPFHQRWQDAERGIGEYIAIFVPWYLEDGYRSAVPFDFVLDSEELDYQTQHGLDLEQMAWRRNKIHSDFRGDVDLFNQEYPATAALAFRRVTGNPLIDPAHVGKARKATLLGEGPVIMGVDPAEYGDDSTAIVVRVGRECKIVKRYNGRGPMEVVGLVANAAQQWQPVAINVDCTGVGSGVADRLIELGYPVNRVHFGEKALEPEQYAIRRDEMWGEMQKWFADQPNRIPDEDPLEADLCAPQYTYDSSRRLKLERKEDMKKRGIRSPDSADALALTFAVPIFGTIQSAKSFRAARSNVKDWRT
jgi:hypothetical protein